MADQTSQSGVPGSAPVRLPSTPYLSITIAGSDGAAAEKPIGAPIRIAIPRELSLRIAAMHVMEFAMKEFKRIGFKDALKAIGLK